MKKLILLVSAVIAFSLVGCSENKSTHDMVHQAAKLEAADECHLCGMLITHFSGPKGQLYRKGITEADGKKVHKFCSTRDMFSFYLEPENKRNVTSMFVHDMSKAPWDAPNDEYFIDAKSAWFVVGSSQRGAMGKTLASFSKQTDAQAFADEFGGEVLAFDNITISNLM